MSDENQNHHKNYDYIIDFFTYHAMLIVRKKHSIRTKNDIPYCPYCGNRVDKVGVPLKKAGDGYAA